MKSVNITVNNKNVQVKPGTTVAAAIFIAEEKFFRRSVADEVRKPLCGMGICYECRVKINGTAHRKSCQLQAEEGMTISTDE